jgi:hypothetical protein
MMVCLSFYFAVPAIIGGFFATITVINKVGPKTLIGAILIFVMLQTAVASPVEDNDPEFEVDRVAAAILSVWLVAAVVMVTLMGGRRELERPDLTTEDSTTATGIDEELGYQGSACDVDRQNNGLDWVKMVPLQKKAVIQACQSSSANFVPMHPPEARTAIAILIKSYGTT